MKEGSFSKWRGSGLANKYTMLWITERGDNKGHVLVEESKREGICIKWWDQQIFDNTHLISHNKYLGYYLLKKN